MVSGGAEVYSVELIKDKQLSLPFLGSSSDSEATTSGWQQLALSFLVRMRQLSDVVTNRDLTSLGGILRSNQDSLLATERRPRASVLAARPMGEEYPSAEWEGPLGSDDCGSPF